MSPSNRSRAATIASLAVCLMAALALSLPEGAGSRFDATLPIFAAAIALLAATASQELPASLTPLGIPLLLTLRGAIPDDRLRLLGYGLTLAAAVAAHSALAVARRESLPSARWLAVLASVLVPAWALPVDSIRLLPTLAAAAGVLWLAFVLAENGSLQPEALAFVLMAGFVTPSAPMRASLFPLVAGCALWLIRGPSPFSAAAAIVAALLAGKWSIPVFAIVALALIAREALAGQRRDRSANGALLFAPVAPFRISGAALATLRSCPEALPRLIRADRSAQFAAAGLGLFALAMRPSLAMLYVIVAIGVVLFAAGSPPAPWHRFSTCARPKSAGAGSVADSAAFRPAQAGEPVPHVRPIVLMVFVLGAIALTGFSGLAASRFPFPVATFPLAVIAAVALTAHLAARLPWAGVAAALIVALLAVPVTPDNVQMLSLDYTATLEPGDQREIPLPPNASAAIVTISGSNTIGLPPGTQLGAIEALKNDGSIESTPITAGAIADWGATRAGHFFTAKSAWPRNPAGVVSGTGREAFIPGAGEIRIELRNATGLRLSAGESLPKGSTLEVHSIGVEETRR